MSITQAALLTATRIELRDESSVTWTDTQAHAAMDQAVAEYSRHRPAQGEATATITTVLRVEPLTSWTITPPDPDLTIKAVEYPVGEWPPRYVRFDRWGDNLTLHTDAELVAKSVRILYTTPHYLAAAAWADLPATALYILAVGAAAYAMLAISSYNSNVITLHPEAAERLRSLAAEKLAQFRDAIAVRTPIQGLLRRPYDEFTQTDIVSWPN